MEAEAPAGASLLARLRGVVDTVAGPPPPAGQRQAAVLLLFDPVAETLPLLFILRSTSLRSHAGQIAFPGGAVEPTDRDLVATALREASEEVALQPSNVEVLGFLPPLLTAVSNLWLTPVVGLQRSSWTIASDELEVAEWFRIDLATLLHAPHTIRELARDGRSRNVHFYQADGRTIWGVSAAILHELMRRLGRRD
jgi:8-oxo-dGTP pyrophosphatase MutT (NUDIX family)